MFSALPLDVQFAALFDSHAPAELPAFGDLRVAEARLLSSTLLVIGFDYSVQHGSIGEHEADQIVAALRRAGESHLPVVFLMNTSGVRVTEGNLGVAALRRTLQAALDAHLDGVRMLALITRNCFGGASVLSTLCERRLVSPNSLFGMSGPKLIEQISGSSDLVASDKDAVRHLLGGEARSAVSGGFALTEDEAGSYSAALKEWLTPPKQGRPTEQDLESAVEALRQRLTAAGRWNGAFELEPWTHPWLVALVERFIGRKVRLLRAGAFTRFDLESGEDAALFGLLDTPSANAVDVQRLMEAVASVPTTAKRVIIFLDCESHAATAVDERIVLSEYLGNLALQVRARHRQGIDVHVIVTGVTGGGIFAALAAAASNVSMLPSAHIRVLPSAAMVALNKTEDQDKTTASHAMDTGAADDVIDYTS